MQVIKEGSQGPYVEYAQLALTRLDYPLLVDGIFGQRTRRAVISFQRSVGLVQDGVVGEKTWNSLFPLLKGYVYYTIKKNDTLFEISKKINTNINKILLANPTINPTNLQIGSTIIVPFGFPIVPTNVSYTSLLVKLIVEGLTVRYPFVSLNSIGASVMGSNLYCLSIGEGENEVSFNASHHANEWITTPILLKFLEEYSESLSSDSSLYGFNSQLLFQSSKLFMVPLVNPDGIDLVNRIIPTESLFYKEALSYAKDYPQIPFPSGWKANISGIDLNLSYPAYWERAREIKFSQGYTSPAPRDYVGNAPLEGIEAKALYDFTQRHNFLLTLSYHTQGEVIFWKFLDYLPPKSREIGEVFAEVSGYTLEETPYSSSFAGYKDWFIMTYNRPGYTIEAGSGTNPLPINQFEKIYRDNRLILINALNLSSGMQ